MYAIRARRKVATERDFLDAVEKVVRQGTKFSSTYVLQLAPPLSLLILPVSFPGLFTKCITRVLWLLHCSMYIVSGLVMLHPLA